MGGRRPTQQTGEQTLQDQEVMRANRELAAYFRGRRTEREARAALKILRAYVRARARMDPKARPPLPGAKPADVKRGATRASKRSSTTRTQTPSRPPDEPLRGDD